MPVWDFSDFADITDNARRITPRHNRNVSISVDRTNLYINENAFPNHAGATGQIIQCGGTGMSWVDPLLLGVTGVQGPTGAFGGPPGETGAQGPTGPQGVTGMGNFYQQSGFSGSTLVPALMWNFQDEAFYGYVTGVNGRWIQVSAGAQVGATGLQGITGATGIKGSTGSQGITGLGVTGLRGLTGLQGSAGAQGVTGTGSYTSNQQLGYVAADHTFVSGELIPGFSFYTQPSGVYSVQIFPILSEDCIVRLATDVGVTGGMMSMKGSAFYSAELSQTLIIKIGYSIAHISIQNTDTVTGIHGIAAFSNNDIIYKNSSMIVTKLN